MCFVQRMMLNKYELYAIINSKNTWQDIMVKNLSYSLRSVLKPSPNTTHLMILGKAFTFSVPQNSDL